MQIILFFPRAHQWMAWCTIAFRTCKVIVKQHKDKNHTLPYFSLRPQQKGEQVQELITEEVQELITVKHPRRSKLFNDLTCSSFWNYIRFVNLDQNNSYTKDTELQTTKYMN